MRSNTIRLFPRDPDGAVLHESGDADSPVGEDRLRGGRSGLDPQFTALARTRTAAASGAIASPMNGNRRSNQCAYPTDTALARQVRVLTRTMQRRAWRWAIQPGGFSRRRSVTRRVLIIGYEARSPETRTMVKSYPILISDVAAARRHVAGAAHP